MPSLNSTVATALARLVAFAIMIAMAGCSSRQVQDSLVGSTAQRLVTHSIDKVVGEIPEENFADFAGQRLYIESHFIERTRFRDYADQRLAVELSRRFDVEIVDTLEDADRVIRVFYTSLGTDQGKLGFFLPLGYIPGLAETTSINLVTLEQFHGVAEMYYYFGEHGYEQRSEMLQSRVRTDAIGLPIITIPISQLP
ncbi:MAG: hypothetical protein R6V61_10165 [Wenzhouxiangellaceae bacterium]